MSLINEIYKIILLLEGLYKYTNYTEPLTSYTAQRLTKDEIKK